MKNYFKLKTQNKDSNKLLLILNRYSYSEQNFMFNLIFLQNKLDYRAGHKSAAAAEATATTT